MGSAGPAPPRVSRETRLLLGTALVSVAALWLLATIRFPEREASPNPLPPVLTQLALRSPFDEITNAVAELLPRVRPWFVIVGDESATPTGPVPAGWTALRLRDGLAAGLPPDHPALAGDETEKLDVVARDRATGLTIVRVAGMADLTEPVLWTPRRPDTPRYLLATASSVEGLSLAPCFVGAFYPAKSTRWPETVWLMPRSTDLDPGTFLLTPEGALAGLVIDHQGRRALVPGSTIVAEAERLIREPASAPGYLGLTVQPLPSSAAADPAVNLVISWVDPEGPAAGVLMPTDLIEAVDGERLETIEAWDAHVARLTPGATISVRILRAGTSQEVPVTVTPVGPPSKRTLGLTLRARPRVGSEVLRVEADSAAAAAGLEPGDLITAIAGVRAPTPEQVQQAFAASSHDRPVLVAVTRGRTHRVVSLGTP